MMTMSKVDRETSPEDIRVKEAADRSAPGRAQIQDVVQEVLEAMLERYRRGRERPQ
jgi:hypothetical protein